MYAWIINVILVQFNFECNMPFDWLKIEFCIKLPKLAMRFVNCPNPVFLTRITSVADNLKRSS